MDNQNKSIPSKGSKFWVFDRLSMRPVKVEFVEQNNDGSWRLKLLEPNTFTSGLFEYIAEQPRDNRIFRTKNKCLAHNIQMLAEQLKRG